LALRHKFYIFVNMRAHVAYPNCKPVNNPVFGDEAITPPLHPKMH